MSDPQAPQPIDHRAHLLRIALEIAQVVSIVAAAISVVRNGVDVESVVLIAAALVLTGVILGTRRPPLPGDPKP